METKDWVNGETTLRLTIADRSIHFFYKFSHMDDFEHVNPNAFFVPGIYFTEEIVKEVSQFLEDNGITQEPWYKYEVEPFVENIDIKTYRFYAEDAIPTRYPYLHTLEFFRFYAGLFATCFPAYTQLLSSRESAYPLNDGFYAFAVIPKYREEYSIRNLKEFFTANMNGTYHRGVARFILEKKNFYLLEATYMLTQFTDIAHVYEGLSNLSETERFIMDPTRESPKPLSQLTSFTRRHLVEDFLSSDRLSGNLEVIMTDSIIMVDDLNEPKLFSGVKTWVELHDKAMTIAKERASGDKDGPALYLPDSVSKVDGKMVGGYKVRPLSYYIDFWTVGQELNNCVGTSNYYAKSKRGESYCFSFENEDGFYACAEMNKRDSGWDVVQISGMSNSILPDSKTLWQGLRDIIEGKNTGERVES